MYVCICHAITDADVESAEKCGATEESEVFRQHGVKPQCGRCVMAMRCLLKERRGEQQSKASPPQRSKGE